MPFYEYECENCKFYTELLQKVSDAPLKKCPSCGRNTMKKLVSAPVFRLKGGGWYETDFKGDKENKRNLAIDKEPETASSDSKPPKPAAGTDAKPAAESKPSEAKASDSGSSRGSTRKASASRSSAAAPKSRAKRAKSKAKSAGRR